MSEPRTYPFILQVKAHSYWYRIRHVMKDAGHCGNYPSYVTSANEGKGREGKGREGKRREEKGRGEKGREEKERKANLGEEKGKARWGWTERG